MTSIPRYRPVALAILFVAQALWARVFFTGSNPHMTVFAFPQDILLMPGEYVFYYGSYENLPWWGDSDEPENKPNNEYLLTGEKRTSDDGESFENRSVMTTLRNQVGFSKNMADSTRVRFDLNYSASPMRNRARGVVTFDSVNASLPYSYRGGNSIQEFYLTSMLATHFRDIPVGFKLGVGNVFTTQPDAEFSVNDNGTVHTSERLLWGFSGDAYRYQDEYAIGPQYKFDLQSAATLPRLKCGARFRYNHGTLDQFAWVSDTGASNVIDEELAGSYRKSVQKIREYTYRVYGNYNLLKRDNYLFNAFALSRFTAVDSIGVIPEDLSVETGLVERSRTFVLQVNPNVNIYPWKYKHTYIDAAILCNYSHMRYNFVRPYWVSGGEKEAYAGTRAYLMEDYSWQNFSYARQHFFEVAFDLNSAFPLYGNKDRSLAAGVTLLLWTRFKWLNKYYGTTNTSTPDLAFDIENIRRNYDRETWMNSVINIIYRRGNYNYRFDIGQPLIYTLTPRTRVTDPSGDNILFENRKESMWVSQSGLRLGFFVSTSLENFLSYRLFNRDR